VRTRGAVALVIGLALVAFDAWGDGLDLDLYDALLARHTRAVADPAQTRVDYAALRTSADWKRLVAGLASARPDALPDRASTLAFWIDAYNVLAIDMVVRNRPKRSIRDVGSLLRPVWKREAGRIGGKPVTLDQIEHAILRKMGDPRIHAAIVCASTSCPSLRRSAYRPEQIDAQLDEAFRSFAANRDKGLRVERDGVWLSPIFEWFEADFAAQGGVIALLRSHVDADTAKAMDRLGPDPARRYFEYDWTLNALRLEDASAPR
jgi:hypothetical protein